MELECKSEYSIACYEEAEEYDFPYRSMERVFYSRMWWLWVIQGILYVGVVVAYFMVRGKELAYAIYIPVDVLLTVSLAAYYYWTYRAEKKKEEEMAKMGAIVMEKFKGGLGKSIKALNEPDDPDAAEQAKMLTEQSARTEESDLEFAKQLYKANMKFSLGSDTYAMAFKALHWKSARSLKLNPGEVLNAFHSAVIVTAI